MRHPDLARAAEWIRSGRLVAFPTETVYGIGANALDANAIARIFELKGRPSTSPLIVHVSGVEMANRMVAAEWPDAAARLANAHWPGPLTLVLKKQGTIPDRVTAGLSTVGVRAPAHDLAQALIALAGVPIAAPSANRFTQLSPTIAEHVRQGLPGVDLILDGGPCTVGIESTVLSLADDNRPTLLRPGMVSKEQIESLIGPVLLPEGAEEAHASPGLHPRHYSPKTPVVIGAEPPKGRGVWIYWSNPNTDLPSLRMPDDPAGYARDLYGVLHHADREGWDFLALEPVPETSEWDAIRDRLRRAACR